MKSVYDIIRPNFNQLFIKKELTVFYKKFIPMLLLVLILTACAPVQVTETPVVTEPVVTEPVVTEPPATPTYETVKIKVAAYPYITEAPIFFAVEEDKACKSTRIHT